MNTTIPGGATRDPFPAGMRRFQTTALLLVLLLPICGCAGSSRDAEKAPSVAPARTGSPEPARESGRPEFPPGKFTVQLGAFSSEEGARSVAATARSRFAMEVYTVYSEADGLHRVMLGVFDAKEPARAFRDSIVRQYPGEYRDAWVSELSR